MAREVDGVGRATVAVRHLVAFVHRHGDLVRRAPDGEALEAGVRVHAAAARAGLPGYEPEVGLKVEVPLPAPPGALHIVGRADGVIASPAGVTLEEIKTTATPPGEIRALREADPPAALGIEGTEPGDAGGRLLDWAQAVCYAAMLAKLRALPEVVVRLRYVPIEGGEPLLLRRRYDARLLADYLDRLARAWGLWVSRAHAWRAQRDASLATTGLPFDRPRPGQAELMEAVSTAVRQGERLFVQAPTGIGKTVAVLLPALRALASHSLDRVFYLTPRGTAATTVLETVDRLRSRGLCLRLVTLTARETLCAASGSGCRDGFCERAAGHNDRIQGALEDLYRYETLNAGVLSEVSGRHRVCPHELGLDGSEWCDLIIGDYNYVFDPRVALRRYQEPGSGAGAQLYLVDEAHNLVERARQMYTAALSRKDLMELARGVEALAPSLARDAATLAAVLPLAAEACEELPSQTGERAGCSPAPPRAILDPLCRLAEQAAAWLDAPPWEWAASGVTSRLLDILFFRSTLARFDTRFSTLVRAGPSDLSVELRCVDPSWLLRERMERARATVCFSATLTPLDYYTALLGGGGQAVGLTLDTPFPRENLRVVLDRSVSTRYHDRPRSATRVARLAASVFRARPGAYLVFLPSHVYLARVTEALGVVAPDLPVMAQRPSMDVEERRAFLSALGRGEPLLGIAVLGGLFGEAVDLAGEALVGAIVAGVGLPQPSPERELIRAHHEEALGLGFEFAYLYPAISRVLQAAGRVIRGEADRGIIVLADDRFVGPPYRDLLPKWWEPIVVASGAREVAREIEAFWSEHAGSVPAKPRAEPPAPGR